LARTGYGKAAHGAIAWSGQHFGGDRSKLDRSAAALDELRTSDELSNGDIFKINGPMSLPVAALVACNIEHPFGATVASDPKHDNFGVAVAHGPTYQVRQLLDM